MSCSTSSTDRQRFTMASCISGIWEQIRESTSADILLFGLALFLGSFFGSFLGFCFAVSLTWVTKGARISQPSHLPKPASIPRRVSDPDFPLRQGDPYIPTPPLRRSNSERWYRLAYRSRIRFPAWRWAQQDRDYRRKPDRLEGGLTPRRS